MTHVTGRDGGDHERGLRASCRPRLKLATVWDKRGRRR